MQRPNSALSWFSFSELVFVQIRHIEEPVALLREVYRNSLKDLSPMDIIAYTEVLAESSPLLGYMNSSNSAKDTSSNSTLTVSMLSFNSI